MPTTEAPEYVKLSPHHADKRMNERANKLTNNKTKKNISIQTLVECNNNCSFVNTRDT